jgi:hypothetical protein
MGRRGSTTSSTTTRRRCASGCRTSHTSSTRRARRQSRRSALSVSWSTTEHSSVARPTPKLGATSASRLSTRTGGTASGLCSLKPRLARNQLDDWDKPSSLCRRVTEVGVLGVDAVSQLPQSLPLAFVLDDLGAERRAPVDDVGMLAEVVVPAWVLRAPSKRRDDRHPIAVMEIQRGIATRLSCSRASRFEERRGKRPRGAHPTPRQLQ